MSLDSLLLLGLVVVLAASLYGLGLAISWVSDRLERWLLRVFFGQRRSTRPRTFSAKEKAGACFKSQVSQALEPIP